MGAHLLGERAVCRLAALERRQEQLGELAAAVLYSGAVSIRRFGKFSWIVWRAVMLNWDTFDNADSRVVDSTSVMRSRMLMFPPICTFSCV